MSPSAQAFPFPKKVRSIEKCELARGLRGSWCQISGKSPLARLKSSRGRRNVWLALLIMGPCSCTNLQDRMLTIVESKDSTHWGLCTRKQKSSLKNCGEVCGLSDVGLLHIRIHVVGTGYWEHVELPVVPIRMTTIDSTSSKDTENSFP